MSTHPEQLPGASTLNAANIALLALDVDGILSDGTLYFSAQGDEIKTFSILDGLGIKMLMSAGVKIAIITGRTSPMVARRARDLGIENVIQGREDKRTALIELLDRLALDASQCAYMGDDLPDLAAIQHAALGFTVPNGHHFIKKHADYCTQAPGGKGAVREVCEIILHSKGLLEEALDQFMKPEV